MPSASAGSPAGASSPGGGSPGVPSNALSSSAIASPRAASTTPPSRAARTRSASTSAARSMTFSTCGSGARRSERTLSSDVSNTCANRTRLPRLNAPAPPLME